MSKQFKVDINIQGLESYDRNEIQFDVKENSKKVVKKKIPKEKASVKDIKKKSIKKKTNSRKKTQSIEEDKKINTSLSSKPITPLKEIKDKKTGWWQK